jgi:glycosyltransferase involved in cell wall biosynthesis
MSIQPRSSRFDSMWICCQSGAREHYAIPRSLKKCGSKVLLLTDLWGSFHFLSKARLLSGLRGRFHSDLSGEEVRAYTWRFIFARIRDCLFPKNWYLQQQRRNTIFQQRCLAALKEIPEDAPSPVVFAYSYAAREILAYARDRGWTTVLGQIDPGPKESEIVMDEYRRLGLPISRYYKPPTDYWTNWREETELADHIVVNSEWSVRCLLEKGVPSRKLHVIPCAYEASSESASFRRTYPATFSPHRPMNVLFLGQAVVRKGVHLVFEAAERLLEHPVQFTIVGGGTDIPDVTPPGNVNLVGQVARHRASQYYREADVFLLPTLSDGFALTQLEALSWKLPVVVSRHCGEVITNGLNGRLLEGTTASSIENALVALLEAPSELQRMSDNAISTARFDLEFIGKKLIDLALTSPEDSTG